MGKTKTIDILLQEAFVYKVCDDQAKAFLINYFASLSQGAPARTYIANMFVISGICDVADGKPDTATVAAVRVLLGLEDAWRADYKSLPL